MGTKKPKEVIKLIETIIFSLLIVVVVFANAYGPIYIRMIPLLFILGIIGNLLFGRPVITTVFGIITSICVVHMKEKYGFFENIFISFNLGLNIVLGEVAGDLIKKTYNYINKHKKKFLKKEIIIYVTTLIFLFVICPVIHGISNGNFIKYNKAKEKLNNYLYEEYKNESKEFVITDANYNIGKERNYLFNIKYGGSVYNFKVYLNDNLNIVDGYKQSILEKNNNIIKSELEKFLNTVQIKDCKVEFDRKTNEIFLIYNFEELDSNFNNIIYNIQNDLEKFEQFKYIERIDKVDIVTNDINNNKISYSTSIELKVYYEITNKNERINYLDKAFDIEYID